MKYPPFVPFFMEQTGKGRSAAYNALNNGHANNLFSSGAVVCLKQTPTAKRGRFHVVPEKFSAWFEESNRVTLQGRH